MDGKFCPTGLSILRRKLAEKRDQRAEESLEGRSQDHKDYTLLGIFSPKLFGWLPIAVFCVFVRNSDFIVSLPFAHTLLYKRVSSSNAVSVWYRGRGGV